MNLGIRCWSFEDMKSEQRCPVFLALLLSISGNAYV